MTIPAVPTPPNDSPRHGRHAGAGWRHWMPGLGAFRAYPLEWLRYDLVAGLVLTSMLVPAGIAYAAASGVPGVYGLYASIVPLLVYALFGPNRVLVMGPDSALAAMILAVILAQSGGDPQHAVALGGAMAIVSGVVCMGAGFARFGFVTELLSKPIRYGFMNGIALTLTLSQLPRVARHPRGVVWAVSRHLDDARAHVRRRRQRRQRCDRSGVFCVDRRAETVSAYSRGTDCDRRRHDRGRDFRSRRDRRRCSARPDAERIADAKAAVDRRRGRGAGRAGRHGGGASRVCRYQCAFAHVCRASRFACGSEPGDGCARRGELRHRSVPGISGE